GVDFKHGDLVNTGHKGVWVTPLYPGKHPLNTRVMKVELVPTTNIVLNWANRTEAHNYDSKLQSITVRSKDGFAFNLDVSQIIHVGALDAPKVISRVGSMQNLVDHVLQPIVGNYFRNSAQDYTVLDFLGARSQKIEHRVILGRVAEIIADNRLKHVIHQVLHRTDAGDHLRRVEGSDVNDLRYIKVEGEAVLRAHRD